MHQYPYLRPIEVIDEVRFMSVEDIIPMKLEAMATRGVKKDFWDINELLNHYSLPQMIEFYQVHNPSKLANVDSHVTKYASNEAAFWAAIMKNYPNAKFSIEGHTDNVGSTKLNQKLSEARAKVVMDALIAKGVKPENMQMYFDR